MTKQMRIKDVGATINLGNYSSLHVTIGESSEFAGLKLDQATAYLKTIAEKVGGVLNLPEGVAKKQPKQQKESNPTIDNAEKAYAFGGTIPILYDHATHTYMSEEGVKYDSVTQLLGTYYQQNAVIAQEYMDFAACYGNLVHTAIQNAVIGKPPKKDLVKGIVKDTLKAMGHFDDAYVERFIALPEAEVAGRFDILTVANGEYTLWDVKTNSDIFAKSHCGLPEEIKKDFDTLWNLDTLFGEHCLQLNLYAYIIEKTTDIKISKLRIIHVPNGFKDIYTVAKTDVSKVLSAYLETR